MRDFFRSKSMKRVPCLSDQDLHECCLELRRSLRSFCSTYLGKELRAGIGVVRSAITAGRTGRLLGGGRFAFSMVNNGIVNGAYEQTHKEKIEYEKDNMRKLNSHLKGFKRVELS
ncbi:hypothetical protein Tco_0191297 [Tanacetum coccineum]